MNVFDFLTKQKLSENQQKMKEVCTSSAIAHATPENMVGYGYQGIPGTFNFPDTG